MSEHNVELTRGYLDAFNARDIDGQAALCDPGIEFHSVFAAVGGATYHGHDGMRTWHRDLTDAWDEIRLEPEAYFDLGEHTLTFQVLHGRGSHSGVEIEMPYTSVLRWREDLIVYMKGYVQRDDALRDLGVSEDELEPIEP